MRATIARVAKDGGRRAHPRSLPYRHSRRSSVACSTVTSIGISSDSGIEAGSSLPRCNVDQHALRRQLADRESSAEQRARRVIERDVVHRHGRALVAIDDPTDLDATEQRAARRVDRELAVALRDDVVEQRHERRFAGQPARRADDERQRRRRPRGRRARATSVERSPRRRAWRRAFVSPVNAPSVARPMRRARNVRTHAVMSSRTSARRRNAGATCASPRRTRRRAGTGRSACAIARPARSRART